MSDDIRRASMVSLDVFRDLGAQIVEVDAPDREPLNALANIILLSEASAMTRATSGSGVTITPLSCATVFSSVFRSPPRPTLKR